MKLTKVILTYPIAVFGRESTTILCTDPAQVPSTGAIVDSIEVTPLGLVVTKGDLVDWLPLKAADRGAIEKPAKAEKGKAA